MLSARADVDMDAAFAGMRRYARNHNQRLTEVATAIANGSLPASTVLG